MIVMIEIEDGLAGYQFKDGNNNVVQFKNLSRLEQVRVLNSFVNGYEHLEDSLKKRMNSMKMWIARTKEHGLYLTSVMPRYYDKMDYWCYNKEYEDGTHMLNAGLQLDSNLFPEVTFENSPMEVELVIKK